MTTAPRAPWPNADKGPLCCLRSKLRLIGTPDDCAARIAENTKLGVRNLYLMPLQTFAQPEDEIAGFRDVVFPRLRALGLR